MFHSSFTQLEKGNQVKLLLNLNDFTSLDVDILLSNLKWYTFLMTLCSFFFYIRATHQPPLTAAAAQQLYQQHAMATHLIPANTSGTLPAQASVRHVYLVPQGQGPRYTARTAQVTSSTPRVQQISGHFQGGHMTMPNPARVRIISGTSGRALRPDQTGGVPDGTMTLGRPASSLGHILIQRSTPEEMQQAAARLRGEPCRHCVMNPTYMARPVLVTSGSMGLVPGQTTGDGKNICMLQHKTISMPNVSLIKSASSTLSSSSSSSSSSQTLTISSGKDVKDERGLPEGASSSPTHVADGPFFENKDKPLTNGSTGNDSPPIANKESNNNNPDLVKDATSSALKAQRATQSVQKTEDKTSAAAKKQGVIYYSMNV